MLLLIIFTTALQLTPAIGLLEDCPIDNDQLADVLETFYNDLKFVKVVTESRQTRNYDDLLREIKTVIRSAPVRERIVRGVTDLSDNQWLQFTRNVYSHRDFIDRDDQGRTYSNFLFAEFTRLRGSTDMHYLKSTLRARQEHTGVSVDQLERLDGITVLQIVCKFNHDADWSHGLIKSPDIELLSLVHHLIKYEKEPLSELRAAVWDRLFNTQPRFGYTYSNKSDTAPGNMVRDDLHLNDLSGQSVSEASIKSILCEFAQKLSILEVSPVEDEAIMSAPSNYSDIIDQVRELDADFADELFENVVKVIDTDIARALDNCDAIRRSLDESELSVCKGNFLTYIQVELKLRLRERCDLEMLSSMSDELHVIKYLRQTREGVSLGNIMRLIGRIVALHVRCFHKRVKWAYALDGNETELQLQEKRNKFGTCQRILPLFDLVQFTD